MLEADCFQPESSSATEEDVDSYYESESEHSECLRDDYSYMDDILEESQEEIDPIGPKKDKEEILKSELADWASANNVRRIHVTKLLHVLHEFLPFLPLDCRTLLKTMRLVSVTDVSPRKYFHFGIAVGVKRALLSLDMQTVPDVTSLWINVDGLPLTKSTNNQFWPVLGKLTDPQIAPPFTIGIYHGTAAPDSWVSPRQMYKSLRGLVTENF